MVLTHFFVFFTILKSKNIKLDIFFMSIFKKFAKRFKIKKNTFLRDIIFITLNANKNKRYKKFIFSSVNINRYGFNRIFL